MRFGIVMPRIVRGEKRRTPGFKLVVMTLGLSLMVRSFRSGGWEGFPVISEGGDAGQEQTIDSSSRVAGECRLETTTLEHSAAHCNLHLDA
ncbi:MAG: hypothetical protein JWP08_1516 [Bryobacterales bacterium]|nr:hypothetical protein [Bryobacterales bacterium]